MCPADHLKPIAAEERRVEEEEKKVREEQERVAKQLAEGSFTDVCLNVLRASSGWIQDLLPDSGNSPHRGALTLNRPVVSFPNVFI